MQFNRENVGGIGNYSKAKVTDLFSKKYIYHPVTFSSLGSYAWLIMLCFLFR